LKKSGGPIRLGMLTPSSNTVLEPLSQQMVAALPDVSVHFARFAVTEIALSDAALAQFDDGPILAAASLLAHARVDVIAWNGTSSSWLGFGRDTALCARITAATGIPATSSILALNEILAITDVRRLGLVTPYMDDVAARIVANYAGIGIDCPDGQHVGLRDNFAFAGISPATIRGLARRAMAGRPDALAVVCTNMRAAGAVADLEKELGLPVYDTIAAAVWKSLALAGADPGAVTGWGSLFNLVVPRREPAP
jgi:maleate isomerase